jgi:hypothetical protein
MNPDRYMPIMSLIDGARGSVRVHWIAVVSFESPVQS